VALKDLASKLENFKYGISTPDKIDKQIDEGVDFFPNDDASGFTPKMNLETLYKRVPAGIDNQIQHGVDYFPNTDAIGFVTNPPKLSSDFQIPSVPKVGGVGINPEETDSADAPTSTRENIEGSYFHMVRDGVMGNTWPAAAISYESDRFSAFNHYTIPIGYEQKLVEEGDTFYPKGDNTPQFKSPFMITPIASYESMYPRNPSVTWNINNLPQSKGKKGKKGTGKDRPGIMTGPSVTWPEAATSYDKTRDVYQNHYLGSPFQNIPLGTNLFDPVGGWAIGSINIFDGDRRGLVGDDNTRKFSIFPRWGRTQFDNPSTAISLQMPAIKTSQELSGRISAKANYSSQKNTGPFTWSGDNTLDISSLTSADRLDEINQLHLYDKNEVDGRGFLNVPAGLSKNMVLQTKTFREVADPFNVAGFRQPFILRPFPEDDGVAGPGNGRWGFDPIQSDGALGFLAESLSEFVGGFVRGAPTFTGLVERNIVDKIRIGKFLATPAGVGFIGKQFALQALNPTLESKVWNPLSVVGIPNVYLGDIKDLKTGVSTLAKLIAGVSLPISHVQRHAEFYIPLLGIEIGGKYEDAIKETSEAGLSAEGMLGLSIFNKDPESRLAYQAAAFSMKIPDIPMPNFNTGIGFIDNFVKRTIANLVSLVGAGVRASRFIAANPNRYLFPVSSAPLTVVNGIPTFTAVPGIELPVQDILDAESPAVLKGSTFVKTSNETTGKTETISAHPVTKRHSTLDYANLSKNNAYGTKLLSPSELNKQTDKYIDEGARIGGAKIMKDSGEQGSLEDLAVQNISHWGRKNLTFPDLGLIKGDTTSANVDRINIHPYGSKDLKDAVVPVTDFIKFRFYDVINKKYIIFRAILSGITDQVKPNYGSENYIGRPDKVYVYQNTDRTVAFNFKVYPKTKQEFPVLLEKMNYLVGMCYPSYTKGERMITPFMKLTMGDMFNDVPGLLDSVTVTVEDSSTWEIEEGLQFPHYISVACSFIYIGGKVLASKGQHYGLSWIPDGSSGDRWGPDDLGMDLGYPKRAKYKKLFGELGQV